MKTSPPLPTNGRHARRPVRVCYMIDRLVVAGTESQLLALIRSVDRSRVQPALCLLDGTDSRFRFLEPTDCPVLRLGVRSLHQPTILCKAARLVAFLKRNRIDVVQVYFPDSTYLGVLAARLAGVRCVIRTRNNLGSELTVAQRRLGRLYNRLTDLTVANCDACRQALLADEAPPKNRVVVLENGIDLPRFVNGKADQRNGSDQVRRVGVVANLRLVKDLQSFVRAAAMLRRSDLQFIIAGEGDQRPHLERLIAQLGLADRFQLPGTVSDVPTLLRTLSVAVLCSRSEGLSNALLEYMAAGLPIVTTNVGGSTGLIEHGMNGLLVPPGNPARLAEAIDVLLDDRRLARDLGRAARQRAVATFSHEARARRFEQLYFDLTKKPAASSDERVGRATSLLLD